MKKYAVFQLERTEDRRLEGTTATLRLQRNGVPSTELKAPAETHQAILLAAYDSANRVVPFGVTPAPLHPLAQFITVDRVATIDKKALGAAYEARAAELVRESELLGESDIGDEDLTRIEVYVAEVPDANEADAVRAVLTDMRARYVADNLANEFPGVSCVRGSHLRID
jgi:hypothetical protein